MRGPAELHALDEFDRAARAALEAAITWRAAAGRLEDLEGRRLARLAADRAIARSAELLAVLDLGRQGPLPSGEHTAGTLLGIVAGRLQGLYPCAAVRCDTDLGAQRARLSSPAAAALAVALTGCVGNALRHGRDGGPVTIVARCRTRKIVIEVRNEVDHARSLTPGNGLVLQAHVLEQVGGTLRLNRREGAVQARLVVPVARRWRHDRAAIDHASAIAAVALAAQRDHGMAQPLMEARWLLPGPETDAVTRAARRLSDAAAQLASALADVDESPSESQAVQSAAEGVSA